MNDIAIEVRMIAQGLEEITIGRNEFSLREINEIISDAEDLFRAACAYRIKVESQADAAL